MASWLCGDAATDAKRACIIKCMQQSHTRANCYQDVVRNWIIGRMLARTNVEYRESCGLNHELGRAGGNQMFTQCVDSCEAMAFPSC